MKKLCLISGAFLFALIMLQCENDSKPDPTPITLAKIIAGGCNDLELKSLIGEPDTVIFTLENDTLDMRVGVNYVCCAPFSKSLEFVNDSVIVTIRDICQDECYCHCMCYYTWDFLLVDFSAAVYNYKVILYSAFEDHPVILQKGSVTIAGNNP